jgi:Ser/Thr protein kinase RdoA (MazF antagonist)
MDYITTADGNKYVLRIYNNGRDSVRVDFEDRVLSALLASGGDLSFSVPTAIPSVIDGRKHVMLSNGAEAILFKFIPGELPKKRWAREIGRASGELVAAMGKISVDMKSPNPRFSELYKAHHATTRDNFFEELKKPCFDVSTYVRKYVDLLAEEVLEIEAKIGK